jgi:segregation and condensation protein B
MDELEVTPLAEDTPSAAESTQPEAEEPQPPTGDSELKAADSEPSADDSEPKTADSEAKTGDSELKAIIEAIVYVTDEPLSAQQIAAALGRPLDKIKRTLDELVAEYAKPEHGLSIREVAAGYKMATKAEHHEAVRAFVKRLTPPLKLSLAALETLAVVAFKQPVTAPEIMEIRGVQGAGVLRTLLDRKLIAESGRKNVVGKPILYKTTKEFLVQFGLKDLNEMPTLKEFEELGRMELVEPDAPAAAVEESAQLQLPVEPPAGIPQPVETVAAEPEAIPEAPAAAPENVAETEPAAEIEPETKQ